MPRWIGVAGAVADTSGRSRPEALDDNATVSVDRSTGKVSVESSENAEQLRKAVEAVGFPSKISH